MQPQKRTPILDAVFPFQTPAEGFDCERSSALFLPRKRGMGMSRITVTIDRLVLSGFERADGKAVAEGLKRELSRVLSEPTTRAHWARSGYTPVLRLPAMGLETGTSGRRKFGAGMARQIGKGLK